MKKYVHLIKMNLSTIGVYRFQLLWSWIFRISKVIVYYSLWSLTAENTEEKYTLLTYFTLFYLIFEPYRTGTIANWMSKAIQTGELNTHLIKPIYYPLVLISKIITTITVRLMVPVLLFLLAIFIIPDIFGPSSLANFILFFFSTLLGIILWQTFIIALGTLSFWVREIGNLLTVTDLIFNIGNGAYIPFYLFSDKVQRILSFTPLKYMGGFQISIYQGQSSESTVVTGFVFLIFWCLFFSLLSIKMYSLGLKKYDASGN